MKSYEEGTPVLPDNIRVEIGPRGPYMLFGQLPIKQEFIVPDKNGNSWSFVAGVKDYATGKEPVALCRCGQSAHKPYCDGAHMKVDWDDRLTAPREDLLKDAQITMGANLMLSDNEKYCAFARFCDAKGRTWDLTEESSDPQKREWAIRTANHCPSGRLKEWDRPTGLPLEPELKPTVGLIEDPAIGTSGGIWLMGGIPVVAPDGFVYQVRNRVTLCRCGFSSNKPFCDGTHATAKWHDNLPEQINDDEIF